ncbi:hypothetical protein BGAL_0409g00020 [Botrytis galanthina]|uniref:Uncharacterized protein n=1 Tax=Botrytis galanthina TaxID=278940 RepID=A0A4S8QPW5_9HELO|nr:hypothetical protein BGAL_0409g00020 [Botrytis galanthina]
MQVWSKHELISGPRAPYKHCTEGIPKRNPSPDVKKHSPDSRIQAIKAVKPTDQVRIKVVVIHSCVAVIQLPPPGHTMTDCKHTSRVEERFFPDLSLLATVNW